MMKNILISGVILPLINLDLARSQSYQYSSNGYYTAVYASSPVTWYTAEAMCEAIFGSHLASIHNETDQANAYSAVQALGLVPESLFEYGWIGINDEETQDSFEFSDGTPYDYYGWKYNEPNDDGHNENCGHLTGNTSRDPVTNGGWNDESCNTQMNSFVCNGDNSPITTSIPTSPTPAPTDEPTPAPTEVPTPAPTDEPTPAPTEHPSVSPTTTMTTTAQAPPATTANIEKIIKECKDEEECLQQTINNVDSVKCYGHGACRDTIITATDKVEAYGYLSNDNSDITTDEFYAYGYRSGYNSDIKAQNVYGYGYLSLYYSSISPQNGNLTVNLDGFNSGYMSSVYCYEDDRCEIYCGTARGCRNLDFYCYSKATCYYDCNDDADNCPTLYGGIGSIIVKNSWKSNVNSNDNDKHFDFNDYNNGLNINSKIGLTEHEMNSIVSERKKKRETSEIQLNKDLIDNAMEYYQQKGEKIPKNIQKHLLNSSALSDSSDNDEYYGVYYAVFGIIGMLFGISVTYYHYSYTMANDYKYHPIDDGHLDNSI